MPEVVIEIGELLLNLIGLAGVIVLTFAIFALAMWMLAWLVWRLGRERTRAAAEQIAKDLKLAPATSPDSRMPLWRGTSYEHDCWLAIHASYEGPTGLRLDHAGPGFADNAPRLVFERAPSLIMVARYVRPMPDKFTLSTLFSAERNLRTDDLEFDVPFKLQSERREGVLRVFSSAPLRDALLSIYGPGKKRDGTGIMIAANECGLMAYWSSPRLPLASHFGHAVVDAVKRLSARRDFY